MSYFLPQINHFSRKMFDSPPKMNHYFQRMFNSEPGKSNSNRKMFNSDCETSHYIVEIKRFYIYKRPMRA